MKSQVDMALEDFVYSSSEAEALAISLSQTILAKIKDFNFDRYARLFKVNNELKLFHYFLFIFLFFQDTNLFQL